MSIKLKHVVLNSDVYDLCFIQADCVSKIQLLGFLLGEVNQGIAHIHAFYGLYRTTNETNAIKICKTKFKEVMEDAEKLGLTLKKKIRIVGWYHSTPMFTIWPSYLDEETKLRYGLSDSQFVGLIFSNYPDDNPKSLQFSVISYQASNFDGKILSRGVPFRIERAPYLKYNLQRLAEYPLILNDVYTDMFLNHNVDLEKHEPNQFFYPVLYIAVTIHRFLQNKLKNLEKKENMIISLKKKMEKKDALIEAKRAEAQSKSLETRRKNSEENIATAETDESPTKKQKTQN